MYYELDDRKSLAEGLEDMKKVYELVAYKLPNCPQDLRDVSKVLVVYIDSTLEIVTKEGELSNDELCNFQMFMNLIENSVQEYTEIVERTWPGLLEMMAGGQK